jgi:hypothetical protein
MSEFSMPTTQVGEQVLYQAHEGAPVQPAFVVEAAARTVTLWALSGAYGGTLKPSVHHVDDPGVHEFPEWKKYGYWKPMPANPQIAILSEKVALLEKKLAAISPKKG